MSPTQQRPVLVTGAFGNVGRYVVRQLVGEGRPVVATDLRTPAAEKVATGLGTASCVVEWVDLTDPSAVRALVDRHRPAAVIHLAGIIPPLAYARPKVAAAVNVDGTCHLVAAVAALTDECRFVHASSIAVHGSRNPHTMGELTAATELRPCEVYGAGKAGAERVVRESELAWVILRLGAVIFPELDLGMDGDSSFLQAILPSDGRVHAVDVRDVARALVAATTADGVGEVFLIGGDDSYRMTQADLSRDLLAAIGLRGALPPGRPGDPEDDEGWFTVDWMDTAHSQEVLRFQQHSWEETLRGISAHVGLRRHLLPLVVPLVRVALTVRSPVRATTYARPWPSVADRWGEAALTRAL